MLENALLFKMCRCHNWYKYIGYNFQNLGKDGYTKTDEFLEKFQTGGGGAFPIQKFILQILDI